MNFSEWNPRRMIGTGGGFTYLIYLDRRISRAGRYNHRNANGNNVTRSAAKAEEFEAAAKRPLETRMQYAFIRTYKPVMDDARFRAFDTTEAYRRWCREALPDWLEYGDI